VVIDLLPVPFHDTITEAAVGQGMHYIHASYATHKQRALSEKAKSKGVAILPEFGLDPGIDLLLAQKLLEDLDEIHEFDSYGAGFPEASAANNPLKYKISWTFEGVLSAYQREALIVENGRPHIINERDIFAPENIHMIEVEGLGPLESYPNGNVVGFLGTMGIVETVQKAGRYSARWPGHTAFWKAMVDLGFLDTRPVMVEGTPVSPRKFMRDLLAPQLQYEADERDITFIRLDAKGLKDGRSRHVVYEMVDYRDLETGLLSMQRTVGFTISIGAQMLLRGDIPARGLLSPITHVPADVALAELAQRGIKITRKIAD
jgi:saccharopine dehydrogenase-like NADP-dependent oxidoreductase